MSRIAEGAPARSFHFRGLNRGLQLALLALPLAGCRATEGGLAAAHGGPSIHAGGSTSVHSTPAVAPVESAAAEESGTFLDGLLDSLAEGNAWIKLRYRFENVDQDGFSSDAHASTLRTEVGYETAEFNDFKGLITFDNVTSIGNDLYNSTTNGVTDRPVVADPETTEVNQANIVYSGVDNLSALVGRRKIKLDNDRFVGDVGWRQNDQTFDVVSLEYTGVEKMKIFYAFVDNVNRIFGEDSAAGDAPSASNLLNLAYDLGSVGKAVAYWYDVDFDSGGDSTSTLGLRLTGDQPLSENVEGLYALEYAHQTDTGQNPSDVDADYQMLELGLDFEGTVVKLGLEVLEGSGDPGDRFTTPLATLHKFNGWADKFLNTPDEGLEDFYVSVAGAIQAVKWLAVYHDFSSDAGSDDYGSEIDLQLVYPWSKRASVGAKYASYSADDFATDTDKFWLWFALTP